MGKVHTWFRSECFSGYRGNKAQPGGLKFFDISFRDMFEVTRHVGLMKSFIQCLPLSFHYSQGGNKILRKHVSSTNNDSLTQRASFE